MTLTECFARWRCPSVVLCSLPGCHWPFLARISSRGERSRGAHNSAARAPPPALRALLTGAGAGTLELESRDKEKDIMANKVIIDLDKCGSFNRWYCKKGSNVTWSYNTMQHYVRKGYLKVYLMFELCVRVSSGHCRWLSTVSAVNILSWTLLMFS